MTLKSAKSVCFRVLICLSLSGVLFLCLVKVLHPFSCLVLIWHFGSFFPFSCRHRAFCDKYTREWECQHGCCVQDNTEPIWWEQLSFLEPRLQLIYYCNCSIHLCSCHSRLNFFLSHDSFPRESSVCSPRSSGYSRVGTTTTTFRPLLFQSNQLEQHTERRRHWQRKCQTHDGLEGRLLFTSLQTESPSSSCFLLLQPAGCLRFLAKKEEEGDEEGADSQWFTSRQTVLSGKAY